MKDLERRIGALMGVVAYLVAIAAGLASGVPLVTVLLRGSVAAAGGYVVGRLLGHVILQAFLDEMAESRQRQGEATDGSHE
jgi:hypothetical protein